MSTLKTKNMKANQALLHHPFWAASDPSRMRLVRVFDVPSEVNPFAADGVVLRVAAAPGDAAYHKASMAREGIYEGIQKGLITPGTTIVEATSGNTGHAMASICTTLGLDFVAVIPNDIPESKSVVMRSLGIGVTARNPEKEETTTECARRLGKQDGWYNPGQYDGLWNPRSHYKHLAPQLFGQTPVSIFALPGGTMGTSMGIAQYARENGKGARIVPVMCAEGQEIPAVRTLARVDKDIRLPWRQHLSDADIQFCNRYPAFFLSFLSWRFIPIQPGLGPSFGAAFVGALKFLREHKAAGTLDQFRKPDGNIYTVVFGPDDYRPYAALYLAHRFYDNEYRHGELPNLLDVVDLV